MLPLTTRLSLHWNRLRRGLLALVVLLTPSESVVSQNALAPRLVWERQVSDPVHWLDYQAGWLSGREQLALAYSSAPPPTAPASGSNRVSALTISAEGVVSKATSMTNPMPRGEIELAEARSISATQEGVLVVAVEFVEERPWLVQWDGNRAPLLSVPLPGPSRFRLNHLVQLPGGGFLALGHRRFNAAWVRFRQDGTLIQEMTTDWGAMDFYLDGILLDNGGTAIVGNSGVFDMLGRGHSKLILQTHDSNGQLLKEWTQPGRRGSLLRLEGGRLAVVYDQSRSENQSIRLKILKSDDLTELHDFEVLQAPGGPSHFRVRQGRGQRLIVAGRRDEGLFLAFFDVPKGRIWSGIIQGVEPAVDFDVFSTGNGYFYVASSPYIGATAAELRKVVRVHKFAEPELLP